MKSATKGLETTLIRHMMKGASHPLLGFRLTVTQTTAMQKEVKMSPRIGESKGMLHIEAVQLPWRAQACKSGFDSHSCSGQYRQTEGFTSSVSQPDAILSHAQHVCSCCSMAILPLLIMGSTALTVPGPECPLCCWCFLMHMYMYTDILLQLLQSVRVHSSEPSDSTWL